MAMSHRTDLLTLCHALQEAGIWLSFNEDDRLIVGPTSLVKKHPELLEGVRAHKAELLQLLEESLAHGLFGEKADDPRFEREECSDCHQMCLIVLNPRRVGVHRLPDGTTVCPGSHRAQTTAVGLIMVAFLADRCVLQPKQVLSWHALRGALEGWCAERTFFLPPRPFVLAWLDAHFTRVDLHRNDHNAFWEGLTLTLPEWGLEDTETPPMAQKPAEQAPRSKLTLKA